MKAVCRFALAAVLCAAAAPAVSAQQPAAPAQGSAAAGRPSRPRSRTRSPSSSPTQPKYEETVVVSASRTEEKLINAPATMTVIGPQTIQSAPTQNFAELLRAVPGRQHHAGVGARHQRHLARRDRHARRPARSRCSTAAASTRTSSASSCGTSCPVNLNEIKQIEVIRGPASAVWGANALNGVVNVITKSPREMQGTSAVLGVGGFDRQRAPPATAPGAGTLFYISGTHAQAVNDRVAFKISAGGYTQDPYARPTGADPVRSPRGLRHGAQGLSRLRQPGHDAAEVRRRASTTTTPTARS